MPFKIKTGTASIGITRAAQPHRMAPDRPLLEAARKHRANRQLSGMGHFLPWVSYGIQRMLHNTELSQVVSRGSVIGVDVGWSIRRKTSAICKIRWNENSVEFFTECFSAIEHEAMSVFENFSDDRIEVAAFDGPIRGDLREIGEYRLAEKALTVGPIRSLIGKPGQANSKNGRTLNQYTNIYAKIVIDVFSLSDSKHEPAIHKKAIVEAFPTTFLGLMIRNPEDIRCKRSNRSDKFFQHLYSDGTLRALFHNLLPKRNLTTSLGVASNHDKRAALVCALSALCVSAGDFTTVGDQNGYIVLPPRKFISDRHWDSISDTAYQFRPAL